MKQIFHKIRQHFKKPTNWTCPICLEELSQTDLEWRCVPECQRDKRHDFNPDDTASPTTRLISNASEQSFPCPTNDCSHILTRPYVKKCAYPFSERINRPPNRHHHCLIIGLDGNPKTSRKGVAAFFYALRLLAADHYHLYPALPETYKMWGLPELKNGTPKLKGVEPIAIELSSTSSQQEWPLLVYLHPFPRTSNEDFSKKVIAVKECQFKKSNLIQKIARTQSVVICINAEEALDSEAVRETKIAEPAKQLSDALIKASKTGLNLTRTRLWITLANHNRLFSRLEQNEPRIKPLKPTVSAPIDEKILKDYLLYSARLKPVLEKLLDLPWQQTRFAMFDAPFDKTETVIGLSSWVEEIKKESQ